MTSEQKTQRSRRVAGSISAAQCSLASIRPSVSRSGNCRPATKTAERRITAEPAPIWMAALLATGCEASANGSNHTVRWDCASGRAMYTNHSAEAEMIHPLGVWLQCGDTLAVTWMPGETAYTLEVYKSSSTHYLA
jgi:hypothetical protein